MTCQEFEALVTDIVHDGSVTGSRRQRGASNVDALAHVKRCRRCAARLAEEAWLSAALRVVSAPHADASAPPRVEAALVAAFRAPRAPSAEPPATGFSPVRVVPWRRAAWAGLAAAAALLIATSVVLDRRSPPGPAGTRDVRGTDHAVVGQAPARTPAGQQVSAAPVTDTSPSTAQAAESTAEMTGHVQPRVAPRSVTAATASDTNAGGDTSAPFVMLPWVGGTGVTAAGAQTTAQLDTAAMVRVSVSRAALVALGVPALHTGDPTGTVQIDVIVGDDGRARAIRIVDAAVFGSGLAPPED